MELFNFIGNLLLFVVVVCWVGFIGFLVFGIGGLICFAVGEVFDGIGGNSGGMSRWFKENELIGRFRALLGIRWLLWRANRQLDRWR